MYSNTATLKTPDVAIQVDFLTLLQAGNDHWVATKNAMLGGLAGTLSAHGGESVRASDLLGFEVRVLTMPEIGVQGMSSLCLIHWISGCIWIHDSYS